MVLFFTAVVFIVGFLLAAFTVWTTFGSKPPLNCRLAVLSTILIGFWVGGFLAGKCGFSTKYIDNCVCVVTVFILNLLLIQTAWFYLIIPHFLIYMLHFFIYQSIYSIKYLAESHVAGARASHANMIEPCQARK